MLQGHPPEQPADVPPPDRDSKTAPMEQLVKLGKELSQVEATHNKAETHYGSGLLNLVVAKGCLLQLLAITVSMEEAVQPQQGAALLSEEG